MEGHGKSHTYSPPYYNRPTSPPATPGSHAQPKCPSSQAASNSPPSSNKRGAFPFAHSPPLEHIEPSINNPHFKFTRALSADLSSRPSTSSGFDGHGSRGSSQERYPTSDNERRVTTRQVEDADFVLEELGAESEYNSETEVVRPDNFEDASSEKAVEESLEEEGNIIGDFENLRCEDESEGEDEQSRRYRQKKKRWSVGVFKRSHSQSVGSDSDVDDTEALDAHDVGSSARRLRRRVRGPGDRSSLIFEDLPDHHVVEVDEPDDGSHIEGPPSLPSDTEDFTLRDLPFWVLEDPMEIESVSSHPPSSRE